MGYRLSALLSLLEQTGILPWCATTAYLQDAVCLGSNGNIYSAVQANTGQNPISDPGTHWLLYGYSADTGTANAYVVAIAPVPTALVVGMSVRFLAANTNTAPSTLNVNGLGPIPITIGVNNPLPLGTILAGGMVQVIYDGTQFQLETGGQIAVGVAPAPTLLSPSNGATGIAISPTLSWLGSSATYEIQVGSVAGFGSGVVYDGTGLSGSSVNIGSVCANNTLYYWRGKGTGGTWSAAWTFTTVTSGGGGFGATSPTLYSPSNGATGQGTHPTLAWNALSNAVTYYLSVEDLSASGGPFVFIQDGITATSVNIGSVCTVGHVYEWYVYGTNSWAFRVKCLCPSGALPLRKRT